MEFRQLRYFVRIVECGSFSRAAEHLNVAQPALSRHVRNLEAELGVKLLERTGRGVTPTEFGILMLERAQVVIYQITDLRTAIETKAGKVSGGVVLGITPTIGTVIEDTLIDVAHNRFPDISLKIVESMRGFAEQWLEWVGSGRIDLAIVYDHDSHSSALTFEPLTTEELCLMGKPDKLPIGGDLPFKLLNQFPLILPRLYSQPQADTRFRG